MITTQCLLIIFFGFFILLFASADAFKASGIIVIVLGLHAMILGGRG